VLRLWVAPSFRAPDGAATGAVRVRVPRSESVLGRVEIEAEVADNGAEILVEGLGPEDRSCSNDVGFSVDVQAGAEVRSARLVGELAEDASLSASTPLPASPPLERTIETETPDGELRLELDTARGEVVVPLALARTPVSSRRVDGFDVLGRPAVDIIFVLDDSASMMRLSDQPEPATEGNIRVEVDGSEIRRREESGRVNWTYDFTSNAINFTPLAVPGPMSHIRVEYDTDGCP